MHLTGLDMSLSWLDGYHPMPGIALTNFSLEMSGRVPAVQLRWEYPYKIRNLGFDSRPLQAASISGVKWPGAARIILKTEDVPLSEINYVAGIDSMPGDWRLNDEYSGKTIPDFEAPAADPIIGTEIDLASLAAMMGDPDFNLNGMSGDRSALQQTLWLSD